MAKKKPARRSAAAKDLVLAGGATPRLRKRRSNDWTKAREESFLSTLAETCNVTLAAQAAGISTNSAYERRKKVAAFRAGWREAIATAYERLELVMLERSLNGTEKIIIRKDGSEERMREYPNQIALHLLKMHRDTAKEAMSEPEPTDVEDVRERLLNKLQRLKERRRAEQR